MANYISLPIISAVYVGDTTSIDSVARRSETYEAGYLCSHATRCNPELHIHSFVLIDAGDIIVERSQTRFKINMNQGEAQSSLTYQTQFILNDMRFS
jgi:hypothetical protein